ncbi:response regulator transcription factor [Sinobacterium norvegicum]|uniref:response regulator transcription factor n=1 Tax=Sinobacterium norvegicum TaxID=1641715 RepID=UPI001F181BB2|nr:response regulator transcription factor [Sinobacterium norvegicum]
MIADDHPLFRQALSSTLANHYPASCIYEAQDIASLQQQLSLLSQVDVVLLDLNMPGCIGFAGLIHINANYPQVPVIMISADDSQAMMAKALTNGAAGFISKTSSAETIYNAIDTIMLGDIWDPDKLLQKNLEPNEIDEQNARLIASLTPMQFKVASLLINGLLNKQIAAELSVTEATVKAHITSIFRKLDVSSRTQAVLVLDKLGICGQ